MLEIRDLGVSFPGAPHAALQGVTLTLAREKMVVVGANGSGKTTLIRAILGLVSPTSGSVALGGRDVGRIRGETSVSTNLGDVYQLMSLPVRDVVGVMARLKGGDPDEMARRLREFDLDSVRGKRWHELSTGQQKLVGDLFAVSFGPDLVLLDEPFDNVDFARRRQLVRVLQELPAGVLLNTHELDLLSAFDGWRLGLMFEGRLLGPFSVRELDQLYLSRGSVTSAAAVLETSFGTFSVTRGSGDRPMKSATSLNALVEALA